MPSLLTILTFYFNFDLSFSFQSDSLCMNFCLLKSVGNYFPQDVLHSSIFVYPHNFVIYMCMVHVYSNLHPTLQK